MAKPNPFSRISTAVYKPQRQPRYAGNPLIEALPLPLDEDGLFEALMFVPPFDESTREWSRTERLQELLGMSNLMIPLAAHIEMGIALDSMMREGYVGRRPFSKEHVAMYEEIEDEERAPEAFRQTYDTVAPKLSRALVATPGMGKTTTVQRTLSRYPRVIYHPELDFYQIPWLHFEMPDDGNSVKSLLIAIIEAIAELVPDNTYYEDYVVKGNPTEPKLQSSARRLLNKHCVGLLIPDEVQNAANSRKNEQRVMAALTRLANKQNTPVLFIGTPKAQKVLGLDLRIARRGLSAGLGNWDPLSRYERRDDAEGRSVLAPGEFVDFVTVLWRYMWVKNPVPLTEQMLDVIHDCTQGIIDLVLKLLIVAQSRAILDGSETLNEQLLYSVYEKQFELVHPMIDALRSQDHRAIAKYPDLKLLDVKETVEDLSRGTRVKRNLAALTRPGVPGFESQLASVAESIGIEPNDAQALAGQVAKDGTATNMLDAVAQLAKKVTPLKRTGTKKSAKKGAAGEVAPAYVGLNSVPGDFRLALVHSATEGTTVFEQLQRLNLLPDMEKLFCLA